MAVRNVEYIISLRDKFSSKLSAINKNLEVTGKKIQATGKKLTTFVTLPIALLGAAAIKLASDFEETESKFSVVFSSISADAAKSAMELRDNFGLSSLAAKTLLSDTGDLLTGFGFTQESALDLSTQVNKLAVDLASFTNFSGGAEGASAALTKALLGERESVKSLGISILESDVKARVLLNTQKGLTFATIRQAKAVATLQIAQEQSKNAIGDFSRTSQDFANQLRITRARLSDMAVGFGKILLPPALKMVKVIKAMAERFTALSPGTKKLIIVIGGLAAVLGPLLVILGFFISTILPALIAGFTVLTGPIGLVLLGITALTIATAVFRKAGNKMIQVQNRLNTINKKISLSIKDEKEKLRVLFEQLKLTNPKTEERRRIIQRINDQYPELLGNIDLEKAGLNELETAYGNVIKAVENKIKAQILEQELTQTINKIRQINLQLSDAERKESVKSLVTQRDILRITKSRIASELNLQTISATFGEARAKILRERSELVSKLQFLESSILFQGEKEDIESFRLRRLRHVESIKDIESEIKTLDDRKKALVETGKVGRKSGLVSGAITGSTTTITSAAPKTFIFNIENLVETINNNTTTLPQSMAKTKEVIAEALLTALSDVQIQVR